MLRARPARLEDFDRFVDLARLAGPGFTSLAVSDDILKARIKKSVTTFQDTTEISPDHFYLLMLEDMESGQIVGLSGVKAQIGIRDPFFNFRILNIAQKSAVTGRRYDMQVLLLVNEYAGATEVGTLFVHPDYRGGGSGRLISQARYMLMASAPERFSHTIISELRGQVDDTGYSPFWEAIGRKFFQMDFVDADNFSAEHDNQFILDLMPKYPIYAALLPKDAQDAMGKTHSSGGAARHFLQSEGFRYNGVIDIFDGGPSMSAPFKDIRTIKASRICRVVENGELSQKASPTQWDGQALISNNDVQNFQCVWQPVTLLNDIVELSPATIAALNIEIGQTVRVWPKILQE